MPALVAALLLLQAPPAPADGRPRPFVIKIEDEKTGRGVPLVELRTVHNLRYVTDSAGLVAFDEPGLSDQDIFFFIRSFGYVIPADGLGNRGKAFRIAPGGQATFRVARYNLAERIYRVTGGGIYRDSVMAGRKPPIREPVLNAKVLGQDSVLAAPYGGKLRWFWGDTNRPAYPLGNFHSPSATSLPPDRGGLDPDVGVDLTYDPDKDGFARPSAKRPGEGPTWLSGLSVVHDASGRERMYATYEKIRGSMETYRRGLVEWDDDRREFSEVAQFPLDAPLYARGHPFLRAVDGVEYLYFAAPLPLSRVRADPESIRDLSRYEAFTPFAPGSKPGKSLVERDAAGKVVYGWKKATPAPSPTDFVRLVDRKFLSQSEVIAPMRDVITSRPVVAHGGSVNWNAHRRRWVMIFVEAGGVSYLGEVYFAEADTPIGPWAYARKVVTHREDSSNLSYSFYNPKHHAFFDKDGGRTIFFEGTYASTFSGNDDPTPLYDYNQVMYKLDLDHPELHLPVPIYDLGASASFGPGGGLHPDRHGRPIAFFAHDRPAPGTIPVFAVPNAAGGSDLAPRQGPGPPVFHALPFEATALPGPSVALREFVHDDGVRHAYSTDQEWQSPGFRRTGRVVCYVWANPVKVPLPRD